MTSYECVHCGALLETDAKPGSSEPCPACGKANVVPEPRPGVLARMKAARRERKEAQARAKQEAEAAAAKSTPPPPQSPPAPVTPLQAALLAARPGGPQKVPPQAPPAPGAPPSPPPTAVPVAVPVAARVPHAASVAAAPRYGALSIFGELVCALGILAWIGAGVCLILGIVSVNEGQGPLGGTLLMAAGALAIVGLGYVAAGQVLFCIRDIAVNTYNIAANTARTGTRAP